MPVDPAALDSALWWYDVSSRWLLGLGLLTAIAACLTVAAAFKQWQTNNVIEAHNDWRLSQSQERIAELGNETAVANERAAAATLEIEKLRTPRLLNAEQQERILNKIRDLIPLSYDIAVVDEAEPINLMNSLDTVLNWAGWTLVAWNIRGDPILVREGKPSAGVTLRRGLHIEFSYDKRSEWEPSVRALAQALLDEGLPVHALASNQVTPGVVHIVIGTKE